MKKMKLLFLITWIGLSACTQKSATPETTTAAPITGEAPEGSLAVSATPPPTQSFDPKACEDRDTKQIVQALRAQFLACTGKNPRKESLERCRLLAGDHCYARAREFTQERVKDPSATLCRNVQDILECLAIAEACPNRCPNL